MIKNMHNTAKRNIRVVGVPKNEYGTRICCRILCHKCGQEDYVSVNLAKSQKPFCRNCAEKILFTYDHGRQALEPYVKKLCDSCGIEFALAEHIAKKKPQALCPDCFKGFWVWRSRSLLKNRFVLTKSGSHTIRKFINDAI